jgi:hypothetical protein
MRKISLALIACLTLAHAAPASAASASARSLANASSASSAESPTPRETPRQRIIRIPRTASTPTLSEEERYAVREAISKEAKNFRGGDAIVITATAAIIILLGVIIIILLT